MKGEGMMKLRGRHLALVAITVLVGCGQSPGTTAPTTSSRGTPGPTGEPSPTPTVQDVGKLEDFAPLEPGAYFMDPDFDPSTSLRVVYEVAEEGWSQWIGATKFHGEDGHVAVSIVTVANLVTHGCKDRSPADPPIGPTVEDLAAGLADLAPFRVTSAPADVTMYGYQGKHLELTVPDLPVESDGEHGYDFVGCVGGSLASWILAGEEGEPYFGYTEPGYTEEFWILDVEGTRLMIAAERTPGSPPEYLAEQRAILDSIRIEP
jgi:hypothetical protein